MNKSNITCLIRMPPITCLLQEDSQLGSMLELCWKGTREVKLGDSGEVRKFLKVSPTPLRFYISLHILHSHFESWVFNQYFCRTEIRWL